MIRLIHTADLQLGKTFHFASGDAAALLRQKRLEVIDRIAEQAREFGAHAVLVAGDLFDSNTVEDRVVGHAADRLARVPCPVVVIPGNHDHGGADSVFRSPRWHRARPDNVQVALEAAPVALAEGALVVLPAPLTRRHTTEPATLPLTAALGAEHEGAVRVGLAHGAVHGFDSDSEVRNEIELEVISRARLDYLALGDWHGTKSVNERVWYAGAPEPDRFKDNDPGNVLRVRIEGPGAAPQVEAVRVAATRWVRHAAVLEGPADVAKLAEWLGALEHDTLVRLELSGTLALTDMQALEDHLAHAESLLLHLRRRGGGVVPVPTADELGAIATDGYVKEAVDRLLARTPLEGDEGVAAARALHLLYRLHVAEVGRR